MKKYILAINLCSFSAVHTGGKDETAFNLLRGFEKIGVNENIICLCAKNLVDAVKQHAPSIDICVVPQLYFKGVKIKGVNQVNRIIQSVFENRWIRNNKNKVGIFLYANKITSPWVYDIPTMMISHDIQVFENHKLPGIEYTDKAYKKETGQIIRDFKNRDHIIAISEFDKNAMIKYMPWAESKIKRIYDPICFDKMGSGLVKGDEYLTVLNIQWKHKNADTVIRAYALIADKMKQSLILVGKLPKNIEQLRKLAEELGVSERVIFTGFVSIEKLDEIVKNTRIYINASYFEGFGMTAVEMMGRGIPTIVAKNTAQPEVTRGLCYYYEPTDNYKGLAETIMRELQNPLTDERLHLIADEMRKHYSYENVAKEYWDFILECAGK